MNRHIPREKKKRKQKNSKTTIHATLTTNIHIYIFIYIFNNARHKNKSFKEKLREFQSDFFMNKFNAQKIQVWFFVIYFLFFIFRLRVASFKK